MDDPNTDALLSAVDLAKQLEAANHNLEAYKAMIDTYTSKLQETQTLVANLSEQLNAFATQFAVDNG